MGSMYWLRVLVMIFALVGVITVMRQLNVATKQGSSAPLVEIFTGPKADHSQNSIDLCPTRIAEIQMIGGPLFFQKGMRWFMRRGSLEAELDQIAMEKWFGQHCHVTSLPMEQVGAAQPLLKVTFVSGDSQSLMSSSEGFVWMDRKFKSEQLKEALQELAEIPTKTSAP